MSSNAVKPLLREADRGLVTFGNESTGRWSALPGTMRADQITKAMLRRTRPIAQSRP